MSFGGGTTTTTTSTHDQEQMRYLNILRSVPGNDVCADCRSKGMRCITFTPCVAR
jgi:hypothetical protein